MATWADFKRWLEIYSSRPRRTRGAFSFRGHSDAAWPLRTTLDRQYQGSEPGERVVKLKNLLREFVLELLSVADVPRDTAIKVKSRPPADWLECLARHHGLPTTLLDFSRSPYVASYFAFAGADAAANGEVAVWAFDRRKLLADDDVDYLDDVELLADNARALEQRGLFLRLPPGVDGDVALGHCLSKICLPASERPVALADLDEMLITAKSLFRSADAAAKTAAIRADMP